MLALFSPNPTLVLGSPGASRGAALGESPAGGRRIEWFELRREMIEARREAISHASSVSTSSSRLAKVR